MKKNHLKEEKLTEEYIKRKYGLVLSNISDNCYKKIIKRNAKIFKELKDKQKRLFDELCANLAYRSKELPPISKESDD